MGNKFFALFNAALAALNVGFATFNVVLGNAKLAGLNAGVGTFCFFTFLFLINLED